MNAKNTPGTKTNWYMVGLGLAAAIVLAYIAHFVGGVLYLIVWLLAIASLIYAVVKAFKRT